MANPILELMTTATEFRRVQEALEGAKGPVAAFGLQEANKSHLCAALAAGRSVLAVTATDTGAARMQEDLAALFALAETAEDGINEADRPAAVRFLPRETPLVHVMNASTDRAADRVHALSRLVSGAPTAVVCPVAALMQQLAPKTAFLSHLIALKSGDEIAPRELMARLAAAGYERVEQVEGRGQAAQRGDLLDVYPTQARYPVRIEFWGDTIDQMRAFDPVSQRSVCQMLSCVLPPAYEAVQSPEAIARALLGIEGKTGFDAQREAWEQGAPCAGADALLPLLYPSLDTILDYLPEGSFLFLDEPHRLEEAARTAQRTFSEQVASMLERGEGAPEQGALLLGAERALSLLSGGRTLCCYALSRTHPAFAPKEIAEFLCRPAPQYLGDSAELVRDLALWKRTNEAALLFAGEHAEALAAQLSDAGATVARAERLTRPPTRGEALVVGQALPRGFCYPELRLTVLGAQELFGKRQAVVRQTKKRNVLSFSELKTGDYVVHETHGIGRFTGVTQLTVQGNTHDYLLLEYRGGDKLYIPTDQMDRVQKYVGGGEDEDSAPTLSKLGGSDWQGRVSRARDSAKKLAVDLAALYAARSHIKGFAFSKDTAWQKQLEERFPYTETPDQTESIREIKADMERERPMDRLLCGDVGYGKTEVALRAVFKAVQDGKQAAILVPTTILAQQHYNTMTARFSDFPVRTGCLSRFQTPQERKQIKEKLASGQIDVVVGTHALLAKDVKFHDLGLLVIDEEHRFGVNHKERLQSLRAQVDVLTLTATPIPRTLNMSMTGVRDISVIETPPEARYPVQTFVLEYSDGLIVDAVTRELSRGGQAYIVSNRVQGMEGFARRLRELVPEASVLIGHGQMPEQQLEQTMLDFMEHKADVLLCSTIIESGLDIPNVNTIIVTEADRMGLAQLYQLRGRVGRSTRLGYAYFTVQPGRVMNEKAHKRLMAIREFTQFGAGFQLAMRDLEIRGAGSLLGAEQHGHIADVGYEYYMKIVQSAVREARGETVVPETEVTLDLPFSAHIPKRYIPGEVQRLAAYRRIADVDGAESAASMREELEDRYGALPEEVENLLTQAQIRAFAARAQLAQVTVSEDGAELRFAPEAQLDGGRLIAAVSGMQGAALTATDPPSIRIRRKKSDAAAMIGELPQFIYTIMHCVDTLERL